ncbi:MAG TPA: lysylphosphatidylglycerol synthase transmembrane domain-containing protein [Solirubrobacteraceae bacterium]|nr:lysylphosphatidylglycerol synthase transmembrane domain-containing protein [Solirubrobacteraceae bacterium]
MNEPRDISPRQATGEELPVPSRSLRNGLIGLAVFFLLVGGLLSAVPGLRSVAERITDANTDWVAVGIALELLSCAGYVVLFDMVFGRLGRRLSTRLPLAELAVNSVVSLSGIGGLALGAWVLRSKGISVQRIAERSVLLFILTSAVNVGAVVLIGVPMWLGVLPGSHNPLLTLLPAILALAAILGTLALARWAGKVTAANDDDNNDRDGLGAGRTGVALTALSGGVKDALALIRQGDPRLLGAVGYWLFDNLALYACLAAFGSAPSFWIVAMAYLVGMLANSIPIPGGLVAVEGGLVGMLLLFGVRPAGAILGAVVIYRAISLWIPATLGTLAFVSLRREIGEPLQPAEPAMD